MNQGITIVVASQNRKIGPIAATYAAQTTCPASCPLRDGGCYAERNVIAFTTNRLNRTTATAIDLAQAEASAIDRLRGYAPLRVHVVGDCATPETAAIVGAAMVRYVARSGRPAWTYTHAWRDVPIAAWQGASVLASCHSSADVADAIARGYVPALLARSLATARDALPPDWRPILCPADRTSHAITCADCLLCGDVETLGRRRRAIVFWPK